MKSFKRNAVIITVLVLVCTAAYLNWSYNKNTSKMSAEVEVPSQNTASAVAAASPAASDAGAGLYYSNTASSAVSKQYFDAARLNRQQARDAAAAALATVSKTTGASKDMIETSLEQISQIASDSIKEAQLEDLIKAKGFSDCIVYLSDSTVNVTVPSPKEGLPASSVAKITDIVTAQTNYKAADMKIIEVK